MAKKKDSKLLNASEIAKLKASFMKKDISAKDINTALVAAKYLTKSKVGGYTSSHKLATVKKYKDSNYVVWEKDIVKNKFFSKCLWDVINNSKSEEPSKTEKKAKTKSKYFDVDRTIFETRWHQSYGAAKATGNKEEILKLEGMKPSMLRTDRGDVVRSKGELIIANKLFSLGVNYAYEKRVEGLSENVISDFYLEFRYIEDSQLIVRKVYIELWGYENDPKYLSRKKEKLDLYKKSGHTLVEFNDSELARDFDTLFDLTFQRELGEGLKSLRNKDFMFKMSMD